MYIGSTIYIYRSFSVHFPLVDFTNPPTNLKCKVKFNPNRYPCPLVEVRWEPPDFIAAGQQDDYIVYSHNGMQFSYLFHGLHTEIELNGVDDTETIEEVYTVFVATSIPGGTSSPTRCDFSTVERGIHTYMFAMLVGAWEIRIIYSSVILRHSSLDDTNIVFW